MGLGGSCLRGFPRAEPGKPTLDLGHPKGGLVDSVVRIRYIHLEAGHPAVESKVPAGWHMLMYNW